MFEYFAYLDAGTGSMFIQALMGLAMAGSFVARRSLRQFTQRLRMLLARRATN